MLKRVLLLGLLNLGLLVISSFEATAYTYKGYNACYGCGSYLGTWTLSGGQQPGSTAFIVGLFDLQSGALVCVNPGTNQKDVRSGLGGTSTIEFFSSENELVFDRRGKFKLLQDVPSTVAEFNDFCANNPQECDGKSGQELFEETYAVTAEDCKSGGLNWTPNEYLWGNHLATGTVYRDCDPDFPPSAETCQSIDDNVTYSCTTTVTFKNYSKGPVSFKCVEQP
jgi:hypothetical protein